MYNTLAHGLRNTHGVLWKPHTTLQSPTHAWHITLSINKITWQLCCFVFALYALSQSSKKWNVIQAPLLDLQSMKHLCQFFKALWSIGLPYIQRVYHPSSHQTTKENSTFLSKVVHQNIFNPSNTEFYLIVDKKIILLHHYMWSPLGHIHPYLRQSGKPVCYSFFNNIKLYQRFHYIQSDESFWKLPYHPSDALN